MITAKPQHAALNRILSAHRVWSIQWPGGAMICVRPRAGSLDPANTIEPDPDIGKDHLEFGDGARGRYPVIEVVHVSADMIQLKFPGWWPDVSTLRPLDLAAALQIPQIRDHYDLAGLTPGDEEAESIFETFVK